MIAHAGERNNFVLIDHPESRPWIDRIFLIIIKMNKNGNCNTRRWLENWENGTIYLPSIDQDGKLILTPKKDIYSTNFKMTGDASRWNHAVLYDHHGPKWSWNVYFRVTHAFCRWTGIGKFPSSQFPRRNILIWQFSASPSPTPIPSSSTNNGNFVFHLNHQRILSSSHPASCIDSSSEYHLLESHHLCSPS